MLGVFYGTSLMADEVEDKTITYLFIRPIRRGAVLVGKYLAYLACTVFVVLPSVVLVYLLIVPIKGTLGGSFLDLMKDLALLALGLAVYGAVFSFIGAKFKRPLLIGLMFIFGWEPAALAFPGYMKRFTVCLLRPGPGSPRDAERRASSARCRNVPGDPKPGHQPLLAGAIWFVFLAGGPGWSSAGNTCWSSRKRRLGAAVRRPGLRHRKPRLGAAGRYSAVGNRSGLAAT